jgi:D-glycero-D-manno-heptose 1,7-bisphosphate phosphatase
MAASPAGEAGVLLDRDGTIIRDVGYLKRLEEIELLPRALEGIRLLSEHGLKIAVITNQSGVGRGFFSEEELRRIHTELSERIGSGGGRIDGFYYCPHHPTEALGSYLMACDCRKPSVGLAARAASELKLDLRRSYVVGDQATDMELAERIGARGILIGNQPEDCAGESGCLMVKNLWEAANWIVSDLQNKK